MAALGEIEPKTRINFSDTGSSNNSRSNGKQTYVFGVPSSRPELGASSSLALENMEWRAAVRQNLQLCRESVDRHIQISHLLDKATTTGTNFMFVLENGLFELASSGLSDGSLYAVLFENRKKRKFLRFFESGIFQGFFESKGLDMLKATLKCPDKDFFWEKVFTDEDLATVKERYQTNLAEKRRDLDESRTRKLPTCGKRYNSLLYSNKNSIKNALDLFLHHVQTDDFGNYLKCLGVLVNVQERKSYKDKQNLNYYSASKCFVGDDLQLCIHRYREEGNVGVVDPLQIFTPLEKPLSWNQQLKYLSSISNFHKWQHKNVSFTQWLPIIDVKGKYKPASPRNQIMYYFHEGYLDLVFSVCSLLRNHEKQPPESTSTFQSVNLPSVSDSLPSAPKRRRLETVRRLTVTDLVANIRTVDPHYTSENLSQAMSSYEKFKYAVIENGNVFWRRSTSRTDIFAMNDVNMTTGLFQQDCYARMTRVVINGIAELSCSCNMYSTLLQLACLRVSEEEFNAMDISDVKCCHMCLFNEMILEHMEALINNTSLSENRLVKKLELSKGQTNEPVCHLPTRSNRSLKFSVYSDHDEKCTVVSITDNRLCCQSGYCDAMFSSSKRYVIHLDKAENLCPHLSRMKIHYNKWKCLIPEPEDSVNTGESDEEMGESFDPPPPPPSQELRNDLKGHRFNEDTGYWEYPSLSRHRPVNDGSPSLQASVQKRAAFNDDNLGRDVNGYFHSAADGQYYEVFAPEAPDSCKCGAGYVSPDGLTFVISHVTTVYMEHGPAKYKIWIRQCMLKSRQCDIGAGMVENIHFFTRETGAGDEI